jgi:hypothetical protein
VQLPTHIRLEGDWVCALKELRIDRQHSVGGSFFVCSDICQPSIAHGVETPVLRLIELEVSSKRGLIKDQLIFENSYYFPVSRKDIDTVYFSIKEIDSDGPKKQLESASCILHFKKV